MSGLRNYCTAFNRARGCRETLLCCHRHHQRTLRREIVRTEAVFDWAETYGLKVRAPRPNHLPMCSAMCFDHPFDTEMSCTRTHGHLNR